MVGVQLQNADHRLARFDPPLTTFNAVVERVAHQVGERVGDLFDHRFVKLGVGPADLQVDLFAEFLAEVANHTLEAAERGADLHHPQIERGVANRLDQGRDVGGGLHHLLAAQAVGDEGAGCAGNHELADQVDELVEFVGFNPQEFVVRRFGVGFCTAVRGYGRRSRLGACCRHGRGGWLGRCGSCRSGCCGNGLRRFCRRRRWNASRFGRECADAGRDREIALVFDELERRANRVLVKLPGDHQLGADVAGLGVERLHRAELNQIAVHPVHSAQGGQIANERQRVHALAEHAGAKVHADVETVVVSAGRSRRRRL